ncbi:MAG: LysR family transcriptional regulator [Clostridia bacterium]|nr:LysR family transcriptional regulator [Clostridia bacterium]
METKQLITFVTLAKEQSYQKASIILNYAPTTLAKHVRGLEEELGVRLAKRDGTHIALTSGGEKFLPHAQQLLNYYNVMLKDFCITSEKEPNIRIAGGEPLVGYSFSDMLLGFFKENPNIHASVEMVCCSEIPQMIVDEEIDIGFAHDMKILRPDKLDVVPLYKEEICLITTPNNPLADKELVDYDDLDGKDFAFTYDECSFCSEFMNRMRKKGITPKSALLLGSYMSVLNSVSHDDRITLIPSTSLPRILSDGFVRLNWTGEPLLPWVQLIYSAEKPLDDIQERLIGRTRKLAEQRIAACGRDGVTGYVR